MNVLRFFQRRSSAAVSEPSGSAAAARDRLTVLLSHERAAVGHSRLVEVLREEILAVIARHVALDPDKVQAKMDRGGTVSTLEVDIEIPNGASALLAAG